MPQSTRREARSEGSEGGAASPCSAPSLLLLLAAAARFKALQAARKGRRLAAEGSAAPWHHPTKAGWTCRGRLEACSGAEEGPTGSAAVEGSRITSPVFQHWAAAAAPGWQRAA